MGCLTKIHLTFPGHLKPIRRSTWTHATKAHVWGKKLKSKRTSSSSSLRFDKNCTWFGPSNISKFTRKNTVAWCDFNNILCAGRRRRKTQMSTKTCPCLTSNKPMVGQKLAGNLLATWFHICIYLLCISKPLHTCLQVSANVLAKGVHQKNPIQSAA